MADNANCPNGRELCKTLGKQRHHTSMSHHEAKGEDPGWGIRKRVEQELGEGQQGFRKGRGTTDGMFALSW